MQERTDVLCLGWWANGGPLLSRSGLQRLVELVQEVLPEAVPSRWDVSEDFRYRLVDEGVDGLVDFVDAHRWQVLLRAKAPARRIEVYPVPPSQRRGELLVSCLQVELDASVLEKKGAAARLPDAFEQIGTLLDPFYGEARLMRGVAKYEGSPWRFHPSVELYPFRWNGWWGLPVRAPFAAMLGPGYREHWPDFGTSEVAGLVVDNRRPWQRDMESLQWAVPAGLCQECDPHWEETEGALLRMFGGRSDSDLTAMPPGLSRKGFQLVSAGVRPPVWPFHGTFPERRRDPLADLLLLKPTGDGQIRQVAADDPDGEPFEAWERIMPGSEVRNVWVSKTGYPEWPWKLTLAALEFVRSEPLERRLRAALRAALEDLPGVTGVAEEDREILLVAGAPTGFAITKAATEVIDSMAGAVQQHYDGL